jgi:hypothetical protein
MGSALHLCRGGKGGMTPSKMKIESRRNRRKKMMMTNMKRKKTTSTSPTLKTRGSFHYLSYMWLLWELRLLLEG